MNDSPPFEQFAWVPLGMLVVAITLWVCNPVKKPEQWHTSLPCLDLQRPSVEVVAR